MMPPLKILTIRKIRLTSLLSLIILSSCASPPLKERFTQDQNSNNNEYTIEAYSYRIHQTLDLASHNFWVLKDPQKKLVAELHGLSTDRESGYSGPVGTDDNKYSLRAQHFVYDRDFYDYLKNKRKISEIISETGINDTLYLKHGPSNLHRKEARHVIIFKGDEKEAFDRWESAVDSMIFINNLDRDYPSFGFKITGTTVNSNAMYRTFGESMGLPIYNFSGVSQPGINNRLINREVIETHRDQRYNRLVNFQSDELIDDKPIHSQWGRPIDQLIKQQKRPDKAIELKNPHQVEHENS